MPYICNEQHNRKYLILAKKPSRIHNYSNINNARFCTLCMFLTSSTDRICACCGTAFRHKPAGYGDSRTIPRPRN